MIRIALLAVAATAALAAPARAEQRGYTVTEFDRIVVEGPFAVRLETGRAPSATATGSAPALDALSIDVQGRTLRVRANRSAWGGYPGAAAAPATITVSTHSVRSAAVTGAGQLQLGPTAGLRVDLSLSGTGRIAARQLGADQVVVTMVGSGRMELGGSARELRAQVQGWGDLDGSALAVQGLTLATDSAGTISLSAAREANVTASGIGEVQIAGAAACTVRGVSAGRVRCGRAR